MIGDIILTDGNNNFLIIEIETKWLTENTGSTTRKTRNKVKQ